MKKEGHRWKYFADFSEVFFLLSPHIHKIYYLFIKFTINKNEYWTVTFSFTFS